MTEQEGKKKRCCGPPGCGTPGVPWEDGTPSRFCAASECMAWRHMRHDWYQSKENSPDLSEVFGGYCALLGRP